MSTDIFNSSEQRKLFLSKLRVLGAQRIYVPFSGSGDSGNVDDVQCNEIDLNTVSMPWTSKKSHWVQKTQSWDESFYTSEKTLYAIAKELTHDALESTGIDWYNNDGGQGELTIDLTTSPPTIELNVGVNETVVTTHSFSFSGSDDDTTESPCTPATTA